MFKIKIRQEVSFNLIYSLESALSIALARFGSESPIYNEIAAGVDRIMALDVNNGLK